MRLALAGAWSVSLASQAATQQDLAEPMVLASQNGELNPPVIAKAVPVLAFAT